MREKQKKHTVEFDAECSSCDGTGLYRGMGEMKGLAVVCRTCDGTGKVHEVIEYKSFVGRKKRRGIVQVIQVNPGFFFNPESGVGLSYKDWLAGAPFKVGTEARQQVCPAWWFQSADYKLKPEWPECSGCGSFCDCKCFKRKDKCWERFDKEHPKRK